jgi:hypothetical protein
MNLFIDASVFERWRQDTSCRPPNLNAWGDARIRRL